MENCDKELVIHYVTISDVPHESIYDDHYDYSYNTQASDEETSFNESPHTGLILSCSNLLLEWLTHFKFSLTFATLVHCTHHYF